MVDVQMGMPEKPEPSMRQLRHLLRLHHGRVGARDAESCLSSSIARRFVLSKIRFNKQYIGARSR
jgi:hypothetical protein